MLHQQKLFQILKLFPSKIICILLYDTRDIIEIMCQ